MDPDVGMRVSRLGLSGNPHAIDFTFVRGESFFGYLTAFNGEHSRYSPGSCLLMARLPLLISEGVKVFDFLCGSESYKYRFATDEYWVHSVTLVPQGGSRLPRYLFEKGKLITRRFAKSVLVALGLREAFVSPLARQESRDA